MALLFASLVNAQAWNLNGNSGTADSNFIGTTDKRDLIFKVNNLRTFSINQMGAINVGREEESMMQIAISPCNGCYSPWAKKTDGVIRLLKGKNLHFHMPNDNAIDPDPRYSTKTPTSVGITTISFSDLVHKNTLVVFNTGKVTIGTDTYDDEDYKLYVKKGIKTEKIKVEVASENQWADFVFHPEYKIPDLENVEAFIKDNGHLPNIPKAQEVVKNGVNLAEMDAKLLQKIEELTLYVIELNKQNKELKQKVENLEKNK